MEVPILYYNYRCHIRHYDDPNLRKIIQLHIQVCEEIGNQECLPVEGDLITLAFECKGEEQFFYDWLNEGAMHNGKSISSTTKWRLRTFSGSGTASV